MRIDFGRYMVRPGREIGVNGRKHTGGEVLRMERHVAAEFPHLVVEVDALDQPIVNPITPLELELDRSQPHERVSLLEAEIATTEAKLAEMRTRLANEQKAVQAFAAAPHPPHDHDHNHNAPSPETTPAWQASSPTEPASSATTKG